MLPRDRDLNEGSKWTGINSRLPNIALEVTMVTEQVPLVEFVGVRAFSSNRGCGVKRLQPFCGSGKWLESFRK